MRAVQPAEFPEGSEQINVGNRTRPALFPGMLAQQSSIGHVLVPNSTEPEALADVFPGSQ